jgi:hypothetical protein
MIKEFFIRQPFEIGSKKSKSLGFTIPSPIVKKYNLSTSTGFLLSGDDSGINLQFVNATKKNSLPIDYSSLPDRSIGNDASLGGN